MCKLTKKTHFVQYDHFIVDQEFNLYVSRVVNMWKRNSFPPAETNVGCVFLRSLHEVRTGFRLAKMVWFI